MDDLHRLQARIADVRQALSEARSPDVRAFLRELLEGYERALEEREPAELQGVESDAAG